MKVQNGFTLVLAIVSSGVLLTSCRGVQIRQLEERVDKLETRVAVLESQVAAQAKK